MMGAEAVESFERKVIALVQELIWGGDVDHHDLSDGVDYHDLGGGVDDHDLGGG